MESSGIRSILPNYCCPYILLESNFSSTEKFSCALRLQITKEEEFFEWLREFENISKTNWILKHSKPKSNKFIFSRDYVCHHSSYGKRKQDENTLRCKSKECGAELTVRIKPSTKAIRYRDNYAKQGYMGIININFVHSHIINDAESLHWLKRAPELKDVFIEYFNKGLSPSAARMHHEDKIISETPHNIANRRENPPKKWVYSLHNKWLTGQLEDILSVAKRNRVAKMNRVDMMDTNSTESNLSSNNPLGNEISDDEDQHPITLKTETELQQSTSTQNKDLFNNLKTEFERITSMLERNECDESLINVTDRYLKQIKKIQTPAQWYSFCSNSMLSWRAAFGRKIRGQRTSLSHRKNATLGSLHPRVDRPLLGARKSSKPPTIIQITLNDISSCSLTINSEEH